MAPFKEFVFNNEYAWLGLKLLALLGVLTCLYAIPTFIVLYLTESRTKKKIDRKSMPVNIRRLERRP